MTVYTYSFLDTQAAISGPGGAFSIGAGAGTEDEGITVEFVDEKVSTKAGSDGTPMHSLHASNLGKITVRLLKTSPTNALLSQLYAFQTSSSVNTGQNTITVNNTTLGDNHVGALSAIAKHPTTVYSKDGQMLEWTFNVGRLSMTLGSGIAA